MSPPRPKAHNPGGMGGGKGGMELTRLKPGRVVQLLNSSPLGTVLTPQAFARRRLEAGMRIASTGDPDRVNLLAYVAWRFDRRHDDPPGHAAGESNRVDVSGLSAWDAHRERARLRSAQLSRLGRDIGPIPGVADPARRDAARRDFRVFCESYLSSVFARAWSVDHLRAIAKIERAVLEGGLFALAMPRGSGKTSLIEAAALWALLYGHRRYVVCIAADERLAGNMLEALQMLMEGHDPLLEDFPEVCFPLRCMGRARQRAGAQTCMGKFTLVQWGKDEMVLPTIEGSASSGSVVSVAGITGRLRGYVRMGAGGVSLRPDLVLIDDPQTDSSARSVQQCQDREQALMGAVQGLAGPGQPIAGLLACTVIRAGDLADRVLDPALHPVWQGERCRMIESFPERQDLWDRYAQVRRDAQAANFSPEQVAAACNEFYAAHRGDMDLGARVSWEERRRAEDLSALQHAMNLRIDGGEEAFFSEFQNDPASCPSGADEEIRAADLMGKVVPSPRGGVPHGAALLTAFIDVQGKCLYWMVTAWVPDMTGVVVDYGTEPEQPDRYFTHREARRTLLQAAKGAGREGAIRAGLDRLLIRLLGRPWPMDRGGELRIERCLVDAGWGETSDLVYDVCRSSPLAAVLMPSKGVGIGPGKTPIAEWARSPGDRIGLNWKIPAMAGRRACRHLLFDANWWKSCVAARLRTARGDRGSVHLCSGTIEEHRLLIDHLTSERATLVTANSRSATQWELRTPGRDNHWWDCLVGCAVAANMLGVTPPGLPGRGPRKKVSFREVCNERAKRNAARGGP
ncbi:MAG: phage terminase large subunit family protein [Phycisphaeraceae bacterium]|nr:phage terminase large subunit family protein [Phycisphaeraceae bacterium]